MLASILIGGAALVAGSLSAALLLFGHLTGRIRRSTALVVATIALAVSTAIAGGGMTGFLLFERTMMPFGVCLMLAAGINGFLAFQAPRSSAPRSGSSVTRRGRT